MSFLRKREPDNRGVNHLPRQATPPSLKQLQSMLQEVLPMNGRACQLTFGDPPEDYSLAVFKDRQKNDVHWALYRGSGESTMMLWDQAASDPGFIHQLITAQFPGFDLKPVALRASLPAFAQVANEQFMQSSTHTNTADPQVVTGRTLGKPTFEGDLKNIQMPNVLQSIAMSKGNGRLEIDSGSESAIIFFTEGAPVHCVNKQLRGESALIELVGLEEGEFRFYPGFTADEKTIKRRLDTILMEGSALDDQYRALKKLGVSDKSYMSRKNSALTEPEFEQALKKGTGADPELTKTIYQRIDGKTQLGDFTRRLNLNKPQWAPVIFNLSTCNLIEFHDQIAEAAPLFVADVQIDWSQALTVDRMLMRSDTQIYSYPAFLLFLRNESMRWERFGRPLSVVLLQLSTYASDGKGSAEPLSIPAAREVAERINKLKRKTDIFAHYETFGFALLLVETDGQAACAFAARLISAITGDALSDGMLVSAKLGVACIPDDCSTLGSLLARAKPVS